MGQQLPGVSHLPAYNGTCILPTSPAVVQKASHNIAAVAHRNLDGHNATGKGLTSTAGAQWSQTRIPGATAPRWLGGMEEGEEWPCRKRSSDQVPITHDGETGNICGSGAPRAWPGQLQHNWLVLHEPLY